LLNRGAKTEWIPGTILEIAGELELELEVDENPEPATTQTIVERRSQEIEQSVAEEQADELKDNSSETKITSEAAPAFAVSPIYLIMLLACLSALILPNFFKGSQGTPPNNPTKEHYKSIKSILLKEVKEKQLQVEYELWFQWFKEAAIEENHHNYKNASKSYKKIRDSIYDYWRRTGQSEKIQKIVQVQENKESDQENENENENENNMDDLEKICDFTVKKIKYVQWHIELKK
jgi:hypothetical protein